MRTVRFFAALLIAALASLPAAAEAPCAAPKPVCDVARNVFAISSFDPLASAVLIGPGLLITNRHVVADNARAEVMLPGGTKIIASVVPTSYAGDLVLMRAPELAPEKPFTTADVGPHDTLYTIGTDVGRQAIRVYKPGKLLLAAAQNKPLARLYHDAYSQPGNSGGALVNGDGRLVAIVASGGSGRNEAIPVTAIPDLKAQSGPEHLDASQQIGIAYRKCTEALDAAQASRERLAPANVAFIDEQCGRSNNRQLWDLAGQLFGRQRLFDESVAMFRRGLHQDPNAINTMVALAVTLHLAGRYADEVPHLKRLVEVLPADAEVLRLGVQAGAWGGDKALMEKSLDLLAKYHPKLAPLARTFIEKNPTPPQRRPPGAAPAGR